MGRRELLNCPVVLDRAERSEGKCVLLRLALGGYDFCLVSIEIFLCRQEVSSGLLMVFGCSFHRRGMSFLVRYNTEVQVQHSVANWSFLLLQHPALPRCEIWQTYPRAAN